MGILCALLGMAVLVICILHGLGEDIWYDEVFSVRFMEHGYSEIVWLTSQDVHPPLYYWYLKLFHDAGKLLFPGASSVALCKLASVFPFIGIYIYALTLVRKRFGWQVTGIFMLFLVITFSFGLFSANTARAINNNEISKNKISPRLLTSPFC